MRALLKGGNCHVFTDLGVGTDERDAESENPLSLTLPMPIPNCRTVKSPANLSTFHHSPSTYNLPLSKHIQPVNLAIPYYLSTFTNPEQHALNILTTTAPEPLLIFAPLTSTAAHCLCAPDIPSLLQRSICTQHSDPANPQINSPTCTFEKPHE